MPWSTWTCGKKAKAIGGGIVGLTSVVAAWIGAVPVAVEWFKGFDPRISVGSIAIAKAPTQTADDKVALYLNVRVDNESDDAGCLSDFALRVQNRAGPEETKWFFPVFFVDVKKLVELAKVSVDTSASISGSFSPLYLSKSSSVEREIAFMHLPYSDNPKDIMTVETLKPGLYQVDVFVSAGNLPCMKTAKHQPVFDEPVFLNISEKLIGYIKAGLLVSPASADLNQIREQLMQRE